MKKYAELSEVIKLVGFNRMNGSEEVVDYYLVHPKWGREYAFTRKYTRATYELVRGGISVRRLLQIRSKDKMTMMLVKYTRLMLPYFSEEIEWISKAA